MALKVLAVLLAVIVAVGFSNSEAARYGHRPDGALKLMSSLDLDATEQAALKSALSTYGPAVKTAMQNFRAVKKQLYKDLKATTPDGSQLATDAAAVDSVKAQLKAARTQLNSALFSALTPAHLQQLQSQLTAEFQKRLDAKTGRLLSEYTRHLEKQ
jgi:capsule polysaccharide export protein KpsE/RkpR